MALTKKELEIIKNADFSGDSREDEIYREMQEIVEKKTDKFTNPSGVSNTKIDMTETIKQYGYDVDLYKKRFGSVNQSEEDCCKRMIEKINSEGKTKEPKTADNSDSDNDDELILIAEAEAEAVNLLLQLELEL